MKDLDVRKLIDSQTPYSDMTDEQIEAVIDWKANQLYEQKTNLAMLETMEEEYKTHIDKLYQLQKSNEEKFTETCTNIRKTLTNILNRKKDV